MEGNKKNLKFTKRWATFLLLTLFCNMFIIATPMTKAAGNWWDEGASFANASAIQIAGYTFSRDDCSVGTNCKNFREFAIAEFEKSGTVDDSYISVFTTETDMPPVSGSNPKPTGIVYRIDTKVAIVVSGSNPSGAGVDLRYIRNIDTSKGPTLPQKYWPRSIYGSIEIISRDGTGKPVDSSSLTGSHVVIINTSDPDNPQINQRGVDGWAKPVHTGGSTDYYYQIDLPEGTPGKGSQKFFSNTNYVIALMNSTKDGKSCIDGSEKVTDWRKWPGWFDNFLKAFPLTGVGYIGVSLATDVVTQFNKLKTGEVCDLQYIGGVTFSFNDAGIVKVGDEATGFEKKTNGYNVGIEQTSAAKGINLTVTEVLDSPMDKAITSAVKMMLGGVTAGLKWTVGNINGLLIQTEDIIIGKPGPGNTSSLNNAWISIRNIAISLLVMALVIIAFANVAQVDLEQYGLARMIPRIIISIIMAYLSWIIVIFFFDLCAAIQAQAKSLASGIDILTSIQNVNVNIPNSSQIIANAAILIVVIAVMIGVWVCGIVLLFTLLLRIVMLAFLLVVAPLAFILNIMPFTANMYKQWWSEFFKWMFMGPIAFAIISLGGVIASSIGTGTGTARQSLTDGTALSLVNAGERGGMLIGLLIFGASLYMAATLPLQWGGKIMGAWAGAGKKAWSKTGGAAMGFASKGLWNVTGGRGVARTKAFFAARSQKRTDVDRQAATAAMGKISNQKNWFSQRLAGNSLLNSEINKAQKQRDYQMHQQDLAKTYGIADLDESTLKQRFADQMDGKDMSQIAKDPLAAAYFKQMAVNGWTNNDSPNSPHQQAFNALSSVDHTLAAACRRGGKGRDLLIGSNNADYVRQGRGDQKKDDIKSHGTDETVNTLAEAAAYANTRVGGFDGSAESVARLQKEYDALSEAPENIADLDAYRGMGALLQAQKYEPEEMARIASQGGVKYEKIRAEATGGNSGIFNAATRAYFAPGGKGATVSASAPTAEEILSKDRVTATEAGLIQDMAIASGKTDEAGYADVQKKFDKFNKK